MHRQDLDQTGSYLIELELKKTRITIATKDTKAKNELKNNLEYVKHKSKLSNKAFDTQTILGSENELTTSGA